MRDDLEDNGAYCFQSFGQALDQYGRELLEWSNRRRNGTHS